MFVSCVSFRNIVVHSIYVQYACDSELSLFMLHPPVTFSHLVGPTCRAARTLWEKRLSPNVIYSINHLKNDTSTLVVGGLDGVLRVVDQDTGEVLSACIMDETNSSSSGSKGWSHEVAEMKQVRRLPEDARIDILPVASRPPITCLAVGMKKVVTMNNDKYIRVWKFLKKSPLQNAAF